MVVWNLHAKIIITMDVNLVHAGFIRKIICVVF